MHSEVSTPASGGSPVPKYQAGLGFKLWAGRPTVRSLTFPLQGSCLQSQVCVYMYIHIYTCVCAFVHTYTYIDRYIYIHTDRCVYIHACIYIYMSLCVYIYTYIYILHIEICFFSHVRFVRASAGCEGRVLFSWDFCLL